MRSEQEIRTLLEGVKNSARFLRQELPMDDETVLVSWAMAGVLGWVLEETVDDDNAAELIADCNRIIQNYLGGKPLT